MNKHLKERVSTSSFEFYIYVYIYIYIMQNLFLAVLISPVRNAISNDSERFGMLEYLGRTSQCRLSMPSHNLGMLGARCLANATLSILEPFLMFSPWEHLNFFSRCLGSWNERWSMFQKRYTQTNTHRLQTLYFLFVRLLFGLILTSMCEVRGV